MYIHIDMHIYKYVYMYVYLCEHVYQRNVFSPAALDSFLHALQCKVPSHNPKRQCTSHQLDDLPSYRKHQFTGVGIDVPIVGDLFHITKTAISGDEISPF